MRENLYFLLYADIDECKGFQQMLGKSKLSVLILNMNVNHARYYQSCLFSDILLVRDYNCAGTY